MRFLRNSAMVMATLITMCGALICIDFPMLGSMFAAFGGVKGLIIAEHRRIDRLLIMLSISACCYMLYQFVHQHAGIAEITLAEIGFVSSVWALRRAWWRQHIVRY